MTTEPPQTKIITINGQAQQVHILPKGTFEDPDNNAVRDLVEMLSKGQIVSMKKDMFK